MNRETDLLFDTIIDKLDRIDDELADKIRAVNRKRLNSNYKTNEYSIEINKLIDLIIFNGKCRYRGNYALTNGNSYDYNYCLKQLVKLINNNY